MDKCRLFKQSAGSAIAVLFLLVGLSGCSIFGGPKIVGGEYERTVLLEKGTATVCGACPEAAAQVEELVSNHPGEIVHINVHCWKSEFETDELNAHINDHKTRYLPAVFIDGILTDHDQESMEAAFNEHCNSGSPVKIELTASLDDNIVTYDISIIGPTDIGPTDSSDPFKGILRIALCQDSVDYTDDRWDGLINVVRRLPEATNDDEFDIEQNDSLTFEKSIAYDTEWTLPLTAVVWVEDKNLSVFQAAAQKIE